MRKIKLLSVIFAAVLMVFGCGERSSTDAGMPTGAANHVSDPTEIDDSQVAVVKNRQPTNADIRVSNGSEITAVDAVMPDVAAKEKKDPPHGEVVAQSDEKPDAEGKVQRVTVTRRAGKYPLMRSEELWQGAPDAAGAKRLRRVSMVADHVMVRLAPGITAPQLAGVLAANGAQVRRLRPGSDLALISFDGTAIPTMARVMAELRKDPALVRYAEPDFVVNTNVTPNDPSFGQLWGLHNTGQTGGTADADIDAPEAWAITTGSRTVKVGVIDTGIDYAHPDLTANIWNNPGETGLDAQNRDKRANGTDDDGNGYVDDWHGWNFAADTNNASDDHFHGTHVSGTIGATGNNAMGVSGVCWQVTLVPLKFLAADGSGYVSDAVDAVNYSVSVGCVVTNNSWGGGGFSQALKDAIDAAGAQGQLFVAAAGNDGSNNDQRPSYPSSYLSANIISVAASNRFDARASFSNIGVDAVHLAAPGVDILNTLPINVTQAMTEKGLSANYGTISGTSMATPHVAGACVLLKALNPALNVTEIKERILATVDPLPQWDSLVLSGGRLNLDHALRNVRTPRFMAVITSPSANAGPLSTAIQILGTADVTIGFNQYILEAGRGSAPTSWSTEGFTLVNGGLTPVHDGQLARWVVPSPEDGSWTIRLTVVGNSGTKKISRELLVDTFIKVGFPTFAYFTGGMYVAASNAVMVADVVGDNRLEIFATALSNGPVQAVDSSGAILEGWPINVSSFGYVSASDFNGDGKSEIGAAHLNSHSPFGIVNGNGTWAKNWPIESHNYNSQPPIIADVDGDGIMELIINSQDYLIHVYREDGNELSGWPRSLEGGQEPMGIACADINNDGNMEIIAVNSPTTEGHCIQVWQSNGNPLSGWPRRWPSSDSYNGIGFVRGLAVGDIDGDGMKEIITSRNDQIVAIRSDGSSPAGWPVTIPISAADWLYAPSGQALADIDDDGIPEVVFAVRRKNITGYPPDPSFLYVLKGDGTIMPGWPVQAPIGYELLYNWNPIVVGDIDGDDIVDILIAYQEFVFKDDAIICAYRPNGSMLPGWPHYCKIGDGMTPAIADIDLDGRNDFIIGSALWDGENKIQPHIYAWDFNPPGAKSHRIEWGQAGGSAARNAVWPVEKNRHTPQARMKVTESDIPGTPSLFDGSNSFDPDVGGGIVSWVWDFGDGQTAFGINVSHNYHRGRYVAHLTVTDAEGLTNRTSRVIVEENNLAPPIITTHPTNTTVTAGQTATFTVVASGAAPLTYQWKQGTTNVGINSATLSITNAQSANAGSYTCVVTNSAGTATSNIATLTVNAAGPATRTWTGLGANNLWSTSANWQGGVTPVAGDDLVFAGATRLTPSNDFAANMSFKSITFASGASAFTVGGNGITLAGNITNSSANTQTITVPMIVNVATATMTGSSAIILSGVISEIGGARAIAKTGTGTLTLSGANTYTGATTISAGTLVLQGTYASPSFNIAAGAVLELSVSTGTTNYATTTFTGAGTLRKTGAGIAVWPATTATFALSTGSLIDVVAGTLVGGSYGNDVWTSNVSDLTVASGATFNGVEANVRVNKLNGAGIIQTGYSGAGYVAFTMGVNNGTGGNFSGAIINSYSAGNIEKIGTGTQILSGASTYTGTTTITAGTLVLSQVTTYASSTTTVNAPGILELTSLNGAVDNWRMNTILAGAGTINKTGNGWIQTFTNAHTFSGALNVQAGTFGTSYLSSNWSGMTADVNISAGALLDARGQAITVGSLNGAGAVGTTWTSAAMVNVGAGNKSGTLAGVISGNNSAATNIPTAPNAGVLSVTKLGTGTQTLSGANIYTGATTVSAGTLLVNGSTHASSAVAVNGGGRLGGTGTVNGTTTVSGTGILTPGAVTGNAIGTLNTAAVTVIGGSYAVDLNGTLPSSDRINATGMVSLGAGVAALTIANATNSSAGKVYTIVNAVNVTGTFSGMPNGAIFTQAGRNFRINYTATGVTLTDLVGTPPTTWSFALWTGDADSGISTTFSYTAKHSFGNNRTSTTVNGVTFTEGNVTSGTGWSIGGAASYWDGNDDATVTGNSELLAQEFVYGGSPRTVTLSDLTVGQTYEASFFSVGWETGSRTQTFSTPSVTSLNINQDQYNDNMGIRITCIYTATSATQVFTITPLSGNSFHLYALANKRQLVPASALWQSPSSSVVGVPLPWIAADVGPVNVAGSANGNGVDFSVTGGGSVALGTTSSTNITDYTLCANEGQSFALPGICDVAYGANGVYVFRNNLSGTVVFNNATFGDPISGVAKKGYYRLSGAQDAFQMVYRPLLANGELIARVVSLENTNTAAKAGVMVRDAITASSVNAFMAMTPTSGATFQSRTATGGATVSTLSAGIVAPYWVRVVRIGTTVTGWMSSDGITWIQVGAAVTLPLGATPIIGLGVTGGNNDLRALGIFDQVVFIPYAGG